MKGDGYCEFLFLYQFIAPKKGISRTPLQKFFPFTLTPSPLTPHPSPFTSHSFPTSPLTCTNNVLSRGTIQLNKQHRIITALPEELNLKIKAYGSTTLDREDLEQGVEPDSCYYIQKAEPIKTRTLDQASDPPPDLAV